MKTSLIFLITLFLSSLGPDREDNLYGSRALFVDQSARIAIIEMKRTGIPASIKIAQSIVETNWGNSLLSREANNYFGIKCKSWWTGLTIYKVDDDRDSKGNLIPSCFRSYDSMEQSFKDHSEFLLNSPFYKPLFQLDLLDYKAWARGLKECGYATDPNYANRLIETIEKYKLYKYDDMALHGG
jgi:flagellum-specific peptidoglycan hydrolase FlgJ